MVNGPLSLVAALAVAGASATSAPFTEAERALLLGHGPWPPPARLDNSNRHSGDPSAIRLGRALFHADAIARDRRHACARCHLPERAFTDGLPRAVGLASLDRNTPTVVNLAWNRWFGWDGAADSLWAQSIRPILNPDEMSMDAGALVDRIARDTDLACGYRQAFGRAIRSEPPEVALVRVGKALAAFQETLVSARNAFDDFRDALAAGDAAGIARYPPDARRGAKIFAGRGRCSLCHFGPRFTNDEFAEIGVGYFVEPGRVDPGRSAGITALRTSPYNRLGAFNDDPARARATSTRRVARLHRNFGEFRVPSLRGVAATAPYFHAGTAPDLAAAVRHYSELDPERVHRDQGGLLSPLALEPQEIDDLVAFLRTLGADLPAGAGDPAPACP